MTDRERIEMPPLERTLDLPTIPANEKAFNAENAEEKSESAENPINLKTAIGQG